MQAGLVFQVIKPQGLNSSSAFLLCAFHFSLVLTARRLFSAQVGKVPSAKLPGISEEEELVPARRPKA